MHVADLADFFRRVLEDDAARGRYVIGNGTDPTVAEITEAAAVAAGAPGAVPGSEDEARARLGDYFAEVLLLDQGTDAARARASSAGNPPIRRSPTSSATEATASDAGTGMTSHATISPHEAADRLAIRELIDAYAHCADRRDARGQMALFTADTRFIVFMEATAAEPTQRLNGRESLAPVFDNLNTYVATMHFNGQSTVSLDGDRATGESYCLAHHLSVGRTGSAR